MKPLTKEQTEALKDVYYNKKNYFGSQKLFYVLKEHYPKLYFYKQQIDAWLKDQEVYQLTRRITTLNLESKRPKITMARNLKIEIDLIDQSAQPFKKNKYILSVVELYSRHVWLFTLKTKTAASIMTHLTPLLEKYKQINYISCDNGNEFNIENLLPRKMILVKGRPYTPTDQARVERSNQNVQNILRKYREATNKNNWPEILDDIAENLNNSLNRILRDTPANVFNALLKQKQVVRNEPPLLEVGTNVRIINLRKIKEGKLSSEVNNWSEGIYTIVKVLKNKDGNHRYFVEDDNGNRVKGSFNINYLQVIKKVEQPPNPKATQQRIIGKHKNYEIESLKRDRDDESDEEQLGKRRR
jgi:hypothetical protein